MSCLMTKVLTCFRYAPLNLYLFRRCCSSLLEDLWGVLQDNYSFPSFAVFASLIFLKMCHFYFIKKSTMSSLYRTTLKVTIHWKWKVCRLEGDLEVWWRMKTLSCLVGCFVHLIDNQATPLFFSPIKRQLTAFEDFWSHQPECSDEKFSFFTYEM